MLWIFIPYAVMESGYTVMASLLPIREHIDQLTIGVLLDHIFLHPMGPYWYLHTLMICGIFYYIAFRKPKGRFFIGIETRETTAAYQNNEFGKSSAVR